MTIPLHLYHQKLVPATFLSREKRFLAFCRLQNGEDVVAHCANPGSLKGVGNGSGLEKVWLSPVSSKTAKLRWRLEIVEQQNGTKIGVHPSLANDLTNQTLENGLMPSLANYDHKYREVKYGKNSRVDFLLQRNGIDTYVEVKSVSMSRGYTNTGKKLAEFPDAKTARGLKHLHEMAALIEQGNHAVMVYVVQRSDCEMVGIAEDIDKEYEQALRELLSRYQGRFWVESYGCDVKIEGIYWNGSLPFLMK